MTDTGPDPRRGPGPFFFSRQRMLTIFLVIAGFLLLNFAAMYFLQPTFTFPRPPPAAARPQALQEARGEALWSEVDGQRVEAWLLPGDAAGAAPLMIYAHGNGELIDLWADEFAPLRAAGIHVLLVEYPGYGRSGGTPSESSVTTVPGFSSAPATNQLRCFTRTEGATALPYSSLTDSVRWPDSES